MAIPTMAQVLTATIEGDSIPAQNTTGTTIYNAIGFLNSVNAISGNRFPYAISQNLAVGGGTLASVNTDKVSQFASATGDILFLCIGTNDWAASVAIATMQSNLTAIKDYWLTTIQKRIVIIGLLPRTQNGGTPMGSTLISTARTYNSWLVAQRDVANGVHIVDAYDALCTAGTDEPNPSYFKNESGKYLHPNTAGSLVLGQAIWTQLKIDGFKGKDAPPVKGSNIFDNGTMSGSGGTATSPAIGTVAAGITVTGSGGSQARTCTVSNGQRVQFAPNSGDGSSANFKVTATTNIVSAGGYQVGDTVRGWALISTGTLNLCDGPWMQLTDVGSTSTAYYGFNKGGSTTGYFPSNQNYILMSTPDFVVAAGNTGLKPEVVCQVNATGAGGLADVTVHAMGVINSTRTKAISTTDLRGILLPNVNPDPPVAIFDGDYSLGDWAPDLGIAQWSQGWESYSDGTALVGIDSLSDSSVGMNSVSTDRSYSGTKSAKHTMTLGDSGELTYGFAKALDTNLTKGQEFWVQAMFYYPAGWDFGNNGDAGIGGTAPRSKFYRLRTFDSGGTPLGYNDIYLWKEDATTTKWQFFYEGNSGVGFSGLDSWAPGRPAAPTTSITRGVWKKVEYYVKLDNVAGVIRLWEDNILTFEITDLQTLVNATDYASLFRFCTYYNGGMPANQSMYTDDWKIYTSASAPTNLDAENNPFIG